MRMSDNYQLIDILLSLDWVESSYLIANQLWSTLDLKWLIEAAQSGDINKVRSLIEETSIDT